ncbi:MAG: ABC transporter permease [Jatrophihabitans endophyticus]|nr:ABC transporter permease [Jatrophihabitans endophyticus]
MAAQAGVSSDIVTVIQALIVVFVAAPRLTRAIFRLKGRGRGALTGVSTNLAVTVASVRSTRVPRHITAGAAEIVLGVLALFAFALGVRSKHTSIFHFSLSGDRFSLGTWHVEARWVALVLCLLVIAAGIARLTRVVSGAWCAAVVIFGLLVSFMTWSIAGDPGGLNVVSLLQGALFPAAIPLILGALAGVIGERSGVVNVALEGQLLFGAFMAALVGSVSGSVWGGIVGGAIAGAVVALLLSVLAIRYLVDQVIVGVVLNVFVLGITNFFFNQVMASNPDHYNSPGFLTPLRIPGLADIPILGDVFFDGTWFLYFSYVAVAGVSYALFHTRWGLRVRSVGEHPRAADTVGIKVNRTRYNAMLIAGLIAGLAGAMLVLGEGQGNIFSSNMSSGYGYIALAAVIFGRWTPRGAVLAALLFGFASQLQSLLAQASPPIDPNILLMAPYLATIVAVAGFVGRVRAPAADGQPYTVG